MNHTKQLVRAARIAAQEANLGGQPLHRFFVPTSSLPGVVHPVHELQDPADAFRLGFQITRWGQERHQPWVQREPYTTTSLSGGWADPVRTFSSFLNLRKKKSEPRRKT